MVPGFDFDLSSTDFANNVDDVFDREVLGAAFVTYAANSIINHALGLVTHDPVVALVAWVAVFALSVVAFAYWSEL